MTPEARKRRAEKKAFLKSMAKARIPKFQAATRFARGEKLVKEPSLMEKFEEEFEKSAQTIK